MCKETVTEYNKNGKLYEIENEKKREREGHKEEERENCKKVRDRSPIILGVLIQFF